VSDWGLVRLVFHEVESDEGFAGWLAEQGTSVALTSGNRLFLIGLRPDGSVGAVERSYVGAAALTAAGPDVLFLATRYQIWRLQDALAPGTRTADGHDRLYVPQTAWTTGFVAVRGMVPGGRGGVIFVNGGFSCLAALDDRLNFRPLWLPPFVTALAPEDRCHLTGVAAGDEGPEYVTCAAPTDTQGGWREHRRRGGMVLAVPGGEVVVSGLSLPHSPVLDGERLWIANGGAGELGVVDLARGTYRPVALLPGFTRGLALAGGDAVVGVSGPARGDTFDGLDLGGRVPGADATCGIFVVETGTGRIAHWLRLHGVGPEIHDVDLLPGCRWPTAVGYQGDDVEEWVTMPC
jgi:uncharacterized protein (TIGR03032 family)